MSVNSSTFSINYIEQMEAQSNNLTQAEQIECREQFNLSYTDVPLEYAKNPVNISQGNDINNMLLYLNLEPLVIPLTELKQKKGYTRMQQELCNTSS